MRRLSFILVLAILVGGVPIWNAQASATPQTVHSSVLLAQAAAQPDDGFLSGIFSAFDRFVNSVIEVAKSAFGFGTPAKVIQQHAVVQSMVKPPTAEVAPLPSTVPPQVSEPVKGSAPAPSTTVPAQPTAALAAVLAPGISVPESTSKAVSETASETAKGGFSLFGKNTAQPVAPTVTKSLARDTRDTLGLSKVETNAASKTSTSAVLQSAPAVQAPVAPAQSATTTTTTSASTSTVSAASQYTPPVQATVAPSASAVRTEVAAASQPLMYSQPLVDVPARTVPSGPVAVRETSIRPTALAPTRPVVTATREPIVALPRFIDTFVPPTTRPVVAPASRETIAEQTSTTATREIAAQPTSPSPVDSRASILDATETRSAVTPPSDTTATVEPPAELSYRTITIKNETKLVVIQVSPSNMTIIDPATTEAVVCSNEPILSLGEDDTGVTRGVVLGGGTILINPTEFFVKFVRLEGAPFAIDAVAKVCDFFAAHNRLSTPDLMLSMPKLSETSRELVSAKTIVVGGVAFTVATDNSTEKIIRGIVVTNVGTTTADSRTFLKMFPEGNQVAQTITSMAVRGIYPGPFTASLGFRDGTALQCEFSATTDMTCTSR